MFQKIINSDTSKTTIFIDLITSLVSIFTFVSMLAARATTKSEILVNDSFWEVKQDRRIDSAILLGSLFLIVRGNGNGSFDKKLSKNE